MHKSFIVTEEDKNRIIGLHENATKRQYLSEQSTQSQTTGCTDGDCVNGTGTYVWADGSKYTGQWKDDKENGFGTYVWADGTKYTGQYKDGQKNGLGTMVYNDGTKYTGQWENGSENGVGEYVGKNKYIWKGNFKDGKPVGTTFEFLDNTKPYHKQYTSNDVIKKIQDILLKKHYDIGKYGPDGRFGPDTTKAVLTALKNTKIPEAIRTNNQPVTPDNVPTEIPNMVSSDNQSSNEKLSFPNLPKQ